MGADNRKGVGCYIPVLRTRRPRCSDGLEAAAAAAATADLTTARGTRQSSLSTSWVRNSGWNGAGKTSNKVPIGQLGKAAYPCLSCFSILFPPLRLDEHGANR